jgi:hypothetical protein
MIGHTTYKEKLHPPKQYGENHILAIIFKAEQTLD